MPEETQTPQEMTLDDAAEAFGKLESPARRHAAETKEPKQEAKQEAKKAALEGEDQPEEDEEESTEAEEPEDEEPEAAEEEEDEDVTDPESVVTVEVDGKKQRMKLGDLVKGSLRTADYTRKTQQLAEERKKFEGELNSARQQREYYAQALGQMQQAIDSITPAQEPDWNAIARTHGVPAAFEAQTTWNQAMRQRAQIEAERQRVAAEQEAETATARQTKLAEERELMLESIPGWKNPGKAERERKAMIDFAKAAGFSDDDINQVSDHRAVKLLHLAWIGHQVTEKQKTLRPAPEVESVRTARPANGHVRSRDPMSDAARRLEKSGDVDDAADFFGAQLRNERRRR